MRPIKFRAWDKKDGKMYTGIGLFSGSYTGIGSPILGCDGGDHYHVLDTDQGEWDYPTPTEESIHFMQFTGLKDSKGKEIYESDLVVIKNNEELLKEDIKRFGLGEVVVEDGCFEVRWIEGNRAGKIEPVRNYFAEGNRLSVIGNVYENPELL